MADNDWGVNDVVIVMEMVLIDPYLHILQHLVLYDGNMDQTIVVMTHTL